MKMRQRAVIGGVQTTPGSSASQPYQQHQQQQQQQQRVYSASLAANPTGFADVSML